METEVIEVLQKDGWNFSKVSNGIYETIYSGDNGKFSVQINFINLNSSLILGASYFPKVVDKTLISKAAWQLNAINLLISVGSFQINLETGEISYRVGFYFFNTQFQINMMRNVLNAIVSYTIQHYSSINELLNSHEI